MEKTAGDDATIVSPASPFFLVEVILVLILLNFVIILRDFYSTFHYILQLFLHMVIRKENPPSLPPAPRRRSCDQNVNGDDHDLMESLTIEEVKTLMEKVTISEIGDDDHLFEEDELLRVEEVKEAFGVFDKNKDGFIDESELRSVLCTLNLKEEQVSEAECKRMIRAYDGDRDGRIDFDEFVKVLDCSFS